jgi:hypothetical protein
LNFLFIIVFRKNQQQHQQLFFKVNRRITQILFLSLKRSLKKHKLYTYKHSSTEARMQIKKEKKNTKQEEGTSVKIKNVNNKMYFPLIKVS